MFCADKLPPKKMACVGLCVFLANDPDSKHSRSCRTSQDSISMLRSCLFTRSRQHWHHNGNNGKLPVSSPTDKYSTDSFYLLKSYIWLQGPTLLNQGCSCKDPTLKHAQHNTLYMVRRESTRGRRWLPLPVSHGSEICRVTDLLIFWLVLAYYSHLPLDSMALKTRNSAFVLV